MKNFIQNHKLEYFKIVSDLIDTYKMTNNYKGGRKQIYTNYEYLEFMIYVSITGCSWESLNKLPIFGSKIISTSSIIKKFNLWTKLGFFDDAEIILLKRYSKKYKSNVNYIDSTDVINLNGLKKDTSYGQKFKNKRAIRLHTICDENKIIKSVIISGANEKDSNNIENVIDAFSIKSDPTYHLPLYIIGDKGYIFNEVRNKLKKRNIILTYPFRKNMKNKNSHKKDTLLKKRYKIEFAFNLLKRSFKRTNKLHERKIVNYVAHIKIANSFNILNYLNRKL